MKPNRSLLLIAASALLIPGAFAEDAGAACKCEMMNKHASSPARPETTEASQQHTELADLDKLVVEMNGNIGPKRLEAMAAILTRLVEHVKTEASSKAPANPETGGAEAHHH